MGPSSTQLQTVTAFGMASGILNPSRSLVLSDTQAIALALRKDCRRIMRLNNTFGKPKFDGMSNG